MKNYIIKYVRDEEVLLSASCMDDAARQACAYSLSFPKGTVRVHSIYEEGLPAVAAGPVKVESVSYSKEEMRNLALRANIRQLTGPKEPA